MDVSTQKLAELAIGGSKKPVSEPPPEPHVIERVKEIVAEAADGKDLSTVSEGSQARRELDADTAATKNVIKDPDYTDAQKMRFMAHIMGNVPYEDTYTALGAQLVVSFRSLSAYEDSIITRLVAHDEAEDGEDKATRKSRYNNYLLAFSLKKANMLDDSAFQLDLVGSSSLVRVKADYTEWFKQLNKVQFQVLQRLFAQFSSELQGLLEKVNDPVFWPTPS